MHQAYPKGPTVAGARAGSRIRETSSIETNFAPDVFPHGELAYACTCGYVGGLALNLHLTQARGTLWMKPQVYARHA